MHCHCKSWFACGSFFAIALQIQQPLRMFLQCHKKCRSSWTCFAVPLQIEVTFGLLFVDTIAIQGLFEVDFLRCHREFRCLCECFSNAIANQCLAEVVFLQCHCKRSSRWEFFCNAIASEGMRGVFFCNDIVNSEPAGSVFVMPMQIKCWVGVAF